MTKEISKVMTCNEISVDLHNELKSLEIVVLINLGKLLVSVLKLYDLRQILQNMQLHDLSCSH